MSEALLIRLGVSLAAILVVALLVRFLGMGDDVRIRDKDHARALARDVLYDFDPVGIVVDRAGFGALLKDRDGRQMLIRRHGVHFVGRILSPAIQARLDHNLLSIHTGERAFGRVILDLGEEAQVWAAGFRALRHA
jgi:hypothetical protein